MIKKNDKKKLKIFIKYNQSIRFVRMMESAKGVIGGLMVVTIFNIFVMIFVYACYKDMEPQLSICNITKILAFNNYENNSRGMNIYLRMIMEENGEIVTYQNSISMDTKKIDKFSLYFDNRIIPCYYVRRQYNSLSLTDNSHFQTIFLFLGMIIFPSVMFLVFYQIIKFPDES